MLNSIGKLSNLTWQYKRTITVCPLYSKAPQGRTKAAESADQQWTNSFSEVDRSSTSKLLFIKIWNHFSILPLAQLEMSLLSCHLFSLLMQGKISSEFKKLLVRLLKYCSTISRICLFHNLRDVDSVTVFCKCILNYLSFSSHRLSSWS